VGVELKQSYFEQAARNLAAAEPKARGKQVTLWDLIEARHERSRIGSTVDGGTTGEGNVWKAWRSRVVLEPRGGAGNVDQNSIPAKMGSFGPLARADPHEDSRSCGSSRRSLDLARAARAGMKGESTRYDHMGRVIGAISTLLPPGVKIDLKGTLSETHDYPINFIAASRRSDRQTEVSDADPLHGAARPNSYNRSRFKRPTFSNR
jgi:hypothetical protein